MLNWQPEFAVQLIEQLVYGSTIEQAANNKVSESLNNETNLSKLAETVHLCLESQLNTAAEVGLTRLEDRAAHTNDAIELLESISPLVNINRYGTAREISLGHIEELINRLTIQASLAIPYACRNLNDEESIRYRNSINSAHQAILLAELDESIIEEWWQALDNIIKNRQSSLQIAGLCSRLLYQAKKITSAELAVMMQKMLSPAVLPADAAKFFEGFFVDSAQRLLYDPMLLNTVESWISSLEEEAFTEFLPLLRRVFSELDSMERKRMVDTILNNKTSFKTEKTLNPMAKSAWPEHLARITKLIQKDKNWAQET